MKARWLAKKIVSLGFTIALPKMTVLCGSTTKVASVLCTYWNLTDGVKDTHLGPKKSFNFLGELILDANFS